jgi:hypothetical protein
VSASDSPTILELRALAGWIGWGLNKGALHLIDGDGPVVVELSYSAATKLREQLTEEGFEHLLSPAASQGVEPQ